MACEASDTASNDSAVKIGICINVLCGSWQKNSDWPCDIIRSYCHGYVYSCGCVALFVTFISVTGSTCSGPAEAAEMKLAPNTASSQPISAKCGNISLASASEGEKHLAGGCQPHIMRPSG